MINFEGLQKEKLFEKNSIKISLNLSELRNLIDIVKSKAINERKYYDKIAGYVKLVEELKLVEEKSTTEFNKKEIVKEGLNGQN